MRKGLFSVPQREGSDVGFRANFREIQLQTVFFGEVIYSSDRIKSGFELNRITLRTSSGFVRKRLLFCGDLGFGCNGID